VIVDDEDFEGYASLRDEGFETGSEAGFFVARRDDHRDLGMIRSCFGRRHGSNLLL
jgi:hypothetical protein